MKKDTMDLHTIVVIILLINDINKNCDIYNIASKLNFVLDVNLST